jgi:hypothetical protein
VRLTLASVGITRQNFFYVKKACADDIKTKMPPKELASGGILKIPVRFTHRAKLKSALRANY